jgi:hypothetical protein
MSDKLPQSMRCNLISGHMLLGVGVIGMVAPEGARHHASVSPPRPTLKSFSFARAPIAQRSDIARVSPPDRCRLNAYLDTLPIALFQGSPSARPTFDLIEVKKWKSSEHLDLTSLSCRAPPLPHPLFPCKGLATDRSRRFSLTSPLFFCS